MFNIMVKENGSTKQEFSFSDIRSAQKKFKEIAFNMFNNLPIKHFAEEHINHANMELYLMNGCFVMSYMEK